MPLSLGYISLSLGYMPLSLGYMPLSLGYIPLSLGYMPLSLGYISLSLGQHLPGGVPIALRTPVRRARRLEVAVQVGFLSKT
jgi:hypothetical protein